MQTSKKIKLFYDLYENDIAYSHNLKIILVDACGNIILDGDFLDEIKNALSLTNTIKTHWNGKKIDITIKWCRRQLNGIETHFMGDLFSNPAYEIDSIIVNHVAQIISNINNTSNCIVKFHISRLVGDRTICKNTCG